MPDIQELASTDGAHVGQKQSASPDSFPQGEEALCREIKRLRAEKSSLEVKCQAYTDLILRFHAGDAAGLTVPTPALSSTSAAEIGPRESLLEFAKRTLNIARTGIDPDSGVDFGCADMLAPTDYLACADSWMSLAWERHQTKEKSSAIIPAAAPVEETTQISSRGRIYHGYNDNYKWMVNKDGVPVDGRVALAVLRTARLIFTHWRQKSMLAPTFLNLPYEAICAYTFVIEKIHPVLKLAGDHLTKDNREYSIGIYPSEAEKVFKKNGVAKATKTEDDPVAASEQLGSSAASGRPESNITQEGGTTSKASLRVPKSVPRPRQANNLALCKMKERDTGDDSSSSSSSDVDEDQPPSNGQPDRRSLSIPQRDISPRAAPANASDAVAPEIATKEASPLEAETATPPEAEPSAATLKKVKGKPGPPSAPMVKPGIGSGKSLWCDHVWWLLLGGKQEGTTARFNIDWKALPKAERDGWDARYRREHTKTGKAGATKQEITSGRKKRKSTNATA
ncbi:hypothetical protein CONPUDRAFT_159419 [Coniophora puteana RWD-64-598 SS2]|uniref:Uncharacterized protein n=1 Tax=Coniophora puteana (strain RWD-64-598) TaxID=741705 RepID=A0A5M3M8C2_CONPW|nr:uncharacterized protein CONPUDRAFT_159419 [Coniophora puteana RWD-64-598 SS2]EIW75293.1 hypothetical protein CONPUDRAFT_159419 [Coniophora puteana RWD-64-598 SS2]